MQLLTKYDPDHWTLIPTICLQSLTDEDDVCDCCADEETTAISIEFLCFALAVVF